ncbi:MAG: hypothetical protein DCC49_02845 [Acidobacteria bacterium]|nr:MAG: hypothetical protein DCC49_02845 [Acidobacteriota bacterium]
MIPPEDFYVKTGNAFRQGDILLSGVSRLTTQDPHYPPEWDEFDEHHVDIEGRLYVLAGPALVMVTSHDCAMEKEFQRRRKALIAGGYSEDDAERIADNDPTLDRTIHVSPLVDPADLKIDPGNLRAGRVVGYFPVPASADGLVPEALVDLTYRCTVDVFGVTRVASISETARSQLRFHIARLDALRSPELGFGIEEVVGKQILDVEIPQSNPLLVRLRLDDESVVELMQRPGEPRDDGPARRGKRKAPAS